MRYIYLLLCVFIGVSVSAQIQDDFSDGDFSANPVWEGSVGSFIVNGDGELQLNEDEAGQSYLSTPLGLNSIDDREWSFVLQHSFSGSSNNFSRVYLTSQTPELVFTGNDNIGAQGYFLLFGESGSEDAIRLFRDDLAGENPVEIAAGTLGLISSSFTIGVRVLRDIAGNWQVFVDPEGGVNYQLDLAGNDATYNTGSHFGWVCNYTVSNADNFYLDDVYYGDPFVDEEPPELVSVSVLNANELEVSFNELLDETSAENVANYSADNGIGSPSAATLAELDPTTVVLTFSNPFPENQSALLTVEGVEDLSGNPAEEQSLEFTYVVAAEPDLGDVIFNEVFPDPTPALGLPEFEFVELFNASDETFDLGDWEFINTTTSKVLPSQALLPGEFVILCDEDAVDSFTEFGDVIGIPSFTALSNSGDSLTLLSASDQVLDIVVYSDDWYSGPEFADGGVTLERINPLSGCSGSGNWTNSVSFQGGTPGGQNSVFDPTPDTSAPEFNFLTFPTDANVLVVFNEALSFGVLDQLQATLSPDLGAPQISLVLSDQGLLFEFPAPFEPGIQYTLSLEGIEDCEGNAAAIIEIPIERGQVPSEGDLIITEIMADPDDEIPSPNAEYIEVYNASESTLELTSMTLVDGEFNQPVLIESGAYLVITDVEDLSSFLVIENTVGMEGFPSLTNTGRTLTLADGEGNVVDEVTYDISWYRDPSKDDGGYSLELINLEDPCSDGDNWTASDANFGHTAGAQNSVFDLTPDEEAPSALYALVSGPNEIDIYFDEQLGLAAEDLIEVEIGIMEGGAFSSLGYLQGDANLISPENRVMRVLFDGGFSAGVVYIARVSDVVDCWGNGLEGSFDVRFAVPEEAEAGDLIINEVLFNPFNDGTDFVEIYNRSQKNISIEGWKLGNESNGIPDNFEDLIETPIILFPGEYMVFTESVIGVTGFYENAAEQRIFEVDDLPTYGNNEGVVVLVDSLFTQSDRFAYDDDLHYVLIDDTDGVSLERIDFFRPSDDETNWHSASSLEGFATPGYENSQYFAEDPNGVLSTSPEVFSPDNDGFEDVLLISFDMEQPGFTASIRVFDDGGRPIKELMNNELIGTTGSISWNGETDDNRKAPIGMYIIWFEAFHPDGEVIQERKVCTLGHRL